MTASSSGQVRPDPIQAPAKDATSLDFVEESSSSHLLHFSRRRSSKSPATPERTLELSKSVPEAASGRVRALHNEGEDFVEDSESDETDNDMPVARPPMHRPTDERSNVPLLKDERRGRQPNNSAADREEGMRPSSTTRITTFKSGTPDYNAKFATRKRYTYAAFFLLLSLISFTVQAETSVYIQQELGWNKPYCML